MTYSPEQYKAVGQSVRSGLGDDYEGNPEGKKPDAMLRALLDRFCEPIGDIPQTHPHASALSNIRVAAENAKTKGSICAERCFHLHVAEEGVEKWIFHAPRMPEGHGGVSRLAGYRGPGHGR